jgi:hypothetical protein
LATGALVLNIVDGGSLNPYWRTHALNGLLYGCLGAYIAARRPAQRLGWLLVVAGVGYALTSFSSHYGLAVDAAPYQRPLAPIVVWLGGWSWALSLGLSTNFALLLFPDGRLASRRWWPAALVSAIGTAVTISVLAVHAWGWGPRIPSRMASSWPGICPSATACSSSAQSSLQCLSWCATRRHPVASAGRCER